MYRKIKVGITGGIGTGKSTFCVYIEELGYSVIPADIIAKELLVEDKEVREKIIRKFGSRAYSSGAPDFKYLADSIFSHPERRNTINSIIHPPVIKIINNRMETELRLQDLVFVEAALIYEAKIEKLFDFIILIRADEKLRSERVVRGGKISLRDFNQRMKNQISDEKKAEKADFIVDNSGDFNALRNKTVYVLNLLKKISLGP